ncbi:hypothetical protein [Nocardia sp. CA-290969]|uniref:hypothetical protein n=1 Tax=Nocardia sp. CA-290969 TaxID=3239986 RepID=UPI003D90FEC6
MRAFSGILASAAIAGTLALAAAPAQAAPTPGNSGTAPGVTDSGLLPSTGSGIIDAGTGVLETSLDIMTDLVSSLSGGMGS